MASQTLAHEAEASRYSLLIDGELIATADYAVRGETVAITRVFTRPTHRGRGLAAVVTEFAVDSIVADGRKVVPMCWYAAEWFELHPERAAALAG